MPNEHALWIQATDLTFSQERVHKEAASHRRSLPSQTLRPLIRFNLRIAYIGIHYLKQYCVGILSKLR
jgi:hypothetical protein